MNRRQKIIVSVTGIFIVLLTLLGLTFAFFLTKIQGNEKSKSISITTANLLLVYGDDDGSIIGDGEKIKPDTTFKEKTFTVTNAGTKPIESYGVILENVKTFYTEDFVNENSQTIKAGTQTEFVTPEDFELKITCTKYNKDDYEEWKKSTDENKTLDELTSIGTCNGMNGTLPLMENELDSNIKYITNGVLLTNTIGVDEVHRYSAVLTYKDTGNDQSDDMNKTLEGKFNIIDTNNTIDIKGKVANNEPGNYLVTNSTRRQSQINSDGSYKIVGLEAGVHSVKIGKIVKEEDGTEKEQLTEMGPLSVTKGTTAGVGYTTSGTYMPEITITDASRTATANIQENSGAFTINLEQTIENYNPYKKGTLAYSILNNAMITKTDGTVYTLPSNLPSKLAVEPTGYEERNLSYTLDNYGISYYFRGNNYDNYLNFADMCWRIVRIEGDGSIKLILEDKTTTCENNLKDNFAAAGSYHPEGHNSNWVIDTGNYGFNINSSNNHVISNYMSPTVSSSNINITFQNNDKNTNIVTGAPKVNKTMATVFYDFQNEFTVDEVSKLKVGNWCIADDAYADKDKTIEQQEKLTATEIDTYYNKNTDNEFFFESYLRLYSNATRTPSLKCKENNIVNKFNEIKRDNSEVIIPENTPMYVATITADEAALAGNVTGKASSYTYLINWNFRNLKLGVNGFYTLSPRKYDAVASRIYALQYNGDINNTYAYATDYGFRPSIILKNTTLISSGDGTLKYPYEIQ